MVMLVAVRYSEYAVCCKTAPSGKKYSGRGSIPGPIACEAIDITN